MSEDAQIRRENLKKLGKSPTELAAKLGSRSSYWRDVLEDPKKSFGEKAARRAEEGLGLPRGWLDKENMPGHDYYVTEGKVVVPYAGEHAQSGLTVAPAPAQEFATLGAAALAISKRISSMPPSRRDKIAASFATLIRGGPNEDEAADIDVLAPGVTIAAQAPSADTRLAHAYERIIAATLAAPLTVEARELLTELRSAARAEVTLDVNQEKTDMKAPQ